MFFCFPTVLRHVSKWNKVDYKLNLPFKAYTRKHMALSCLPADRMIPVFNLLKQEVNNIDPLPLRKAIQCCIQHTLIATGGGKLDRKHSQPLDLRIKPTTFAKLCTRIELFSLIDLTL